MVEISGTPIISHLMNIFIEQGFSEFVIAGGYKVEVIEKWVLGFQSRSSIEVFNTGLDTQTGGRIKKCLESFPGERIIATYGDGLANINISKLLNFHKSHKKFATVTSVRPPARFGHLQSHNGLVTHFGEKNQADAGWINGGFFVLEPVVANYIHGDYEPFESGALPRLVDEGQLMTYQHEGFWQPMDTLREKQELEKLADQNPPPWLNLI
jgi:glucose-1-phosphate cytidylyltransferase